MKCINPHASLRDEFFKVIVSREFKDRRDLLNLEDTLLRDEPLLDDFNYEDSTFASTFTARNYTNNCDNISFKYFWGKQFHHYLMHIYRLNF